METGREAVSGKTKASIASCGLLSFVGILAETAMNVCFPVLIDELRVSLSTVQWLTTGYLLMATIVMAASAHMLRRFGPRALFLTAALLSVAGTMMCLLAPSFTVLLLGRLLQAVSTGIATPLMFQVIVQRVPREQLGLYTGLASVIISLAPALGPTYGGMLTSLWSWRGIFVGIVPMLAVIIALGTYGIHGKASGTSTRFDFVGLTVLAATFTALLLTFEAAGTHGWLSPWFWGGLLLSAALGIMAAQHIRYAPRRLFDFSILRVRLVRLRLVNYAVLQFINVGMPFVLSLLAQDTLGLSPMDAGMIILPGALMGAASAPIAGHLYDRIGPNKPLMCSIVLMLVSLTLFALLGGRHTAASLVVLYVLLRVGFAAGFGTAVADASTHVQPWQKSDQSSMFSMMQQFAGAWGTSVMAAVIAAQPPTLPKGEATAAGSTIDFALLAAMAAGVLVTILISTRIHRTIIAVP